MDDKKRCVELAKDLITSYFDSLANSDRINFEGLSEAMLINSDDKVLLEHIKAWINILSCARDTLEDYFDGEESSD